MAQQENFSQVLRISFNEADEAESSAEMIAAAGYEVAVVKERFAGEDDDEAIVYVVATTAPLDQIREYLVGDYFVE